MFLPFVQTGRRDSDPELGVLLRAFRNRRIAIPWLISVVGLGIACWAVLRIDSLSIERPGPLTFLAVTSVAIAIGAFAFGLWALQRSAGRIDALLAHLTPRVTEVLSRDFVGQPTRDLEAVYRDICALERELRGVELPVADSSIRDWIASQKERLEPALRRRGIGIG